MKGLRGHSSTKFCHDFILMHQNNSNMLKADDTYTYTLQQKNTHVRTHKYILVTNDLFTIYNDLRRKQRCHCDKSFSIITKHSKIKIKK